MIFSQIFEGSDHMVKEQTPLKEIRNKAPELNPLLAIIVVAIIFIASVIVILNKDDDDDDDDNILTNPADIKYRSTEVVTPGTKHGRMAFNVNIDSANASNGIKLWLPYPTSSEYQEIEDVDISGNFDHHAILKDSESGTIFLYAEWTNPTENGTLSYSFNITRTEIIRKNFPLVEGPIPVEVEQFLLPSPSVPINGTVKAETEKAITTEETILAKSIAIYDYIINNGVRDPTILGCGDGDPCTTIEDGISGKCADIHSVYVAMARSAGIPAREIFGTRISKDGDITGNYHCRAEFYLPGYGWVPVDPSDVRKAMLKEDLELTDARTDEVREYYFGAQTETYVDFYSGRDITCNPAQSAGTVNYLMYPYAEVDGVPLDHLAQEDLQYTVTFQEQA